ncbi:MAG: UPF0104 family protein [Ignavibacteria bacterium]|nr:MAG: UPF0104 family protein [Ignavibacteria bacterium]
MEENKKKYFSFGAKLFITVGILYYVFNYVDIKYAWDTFKAADIVYFSASILLLPVLLLFQYLKWRLICNKFLNVNSNEKIISSLFQGYSAGIFTPFRIGEFIARKFPFKNSSLKDVTVATFIDKFSTMFAILFVGVISLILLLSIFDLKIGDFRQIALITLMILLLILVLILSQLLKANNVEEKRNPLSKLLMQLPLLIWLQNKLELKSKNTSEVFKNSLIYAFPVALVIPMQYALLYHSFDNLSLPVGFLIANAILFIKFFVPPVTIGEIGVREIISVFVFTQLELKPEIAVNAAIIVFLVNLVIPSLIGIYFTIRQKL